MNEIKRIGRELLHSGRVVDFYEDTMEMPDGHSVKWDFVEHKGAAAVLPVLPDGRILMVRQYRNALERDSLEIPAGSLDYRGEPTLAAARRELAEETGYRAASLELLISVYTTVAFSNEHIDIYLATGLSAGEQEPDEDEYIDVEIHDLDSLCQMIYQRRIEDAKTVAAILAYKNTI